MDKNIQRNRVKLKPRQSYSTTPLHTTEHNSFHLCILCGFIYLDTDWHALPSDWRCPDCGTSQKNFDSAQLDLNQ